MSDGELNQLLADSPWLLDEGSLERTLVSNQLQRLIGRIRSDDEQVGPEAGHGGIVCTEGRRVVDGKDGVRLAARTEHWLDELERPRAARASVHRVDDPDSAVRAQRGTEALLTFH